MTETTPNAYLRTKVLTASQGELRLMLFDGAIKFARQARTALEGRDFEGAYTGLVRAQEIVLELINSLQPKHDADLCGRIASLYTYVYQRLVAAGTERKPELIDEVLELLQYERETWAMLLERLADENKQATTLQSTPEVDPSQQPASPAASSLVGGRVSIRG